MSPSEKAKELFEKFRTVSRHKYIERTGQDADEAGKTLALICVEQIIEAKPYYFYPGRKVTRVEDHSTIDYWKEVKKELESM